VAVASSVNKVLQHTQQPVSLAGCALHNNLKMLKTADQHVVLVVRAAFFLGITTGALTPEEISWVLSQPQRALAVGQALSIILQAAEMDSPARTRFDRLISTYTYEYGACKRIYNTAIPQAYTM
jgi:uncharacterized SAM-dependent methyltransferase